MLKIAYIDFKKYSVNQLFFFYPRFGCECLTEYSLAPVLRTYKRG